jgi:hypothetical protein
MKESTFKKHCLVIDVWFANGRNGTKAYQEIYGCDRETAVVNFSKILTNTNIAEYVEIKMSTKSEELGITLSSQLKLLSDIIDSKDERATDKIAAIKEQNKLLALYREHNEQKKNEVNNIINLGSGINPNEVTT